MSSRAAGLLFLGLSVVLAVLLTLDVITPLASGVVFAIGLVLVGALTRGR